MAATATKQTGGKATFDKIRQDELDEQERETAKKDAAVALIRDTLPNLAAGKPVDQAKVREALKATGWTIEDLEGFVSTYKSMLSEQGRVDACDREAVGEEIKAAEAERETLRLKIGQLRSELRAISSISVAAAQHRVKLRSLGVL